MLGRKEEEEEEEKKRKRTQSEPLVAYIIISRIQFRTVP